MSKEANIAAQKKMGEIINSYHFDKLNEVMAPNVKDHDPADDQGPGPEGFAHWFTQFHSAFPDFKICRRAPRRRRRQRGLRLHDHRHSGRPLQWHPCQR